MRSNQTYKASHFTKPYRKSYRLKKYFLQKALAIQNTL